MSERHAKGVKQCAECGQEIEVGVNEFDENRSSDGAKVRLALYCGCETVALKHTHQAYVAVDRVPEKWNRVL